MFNNKNNILHRKNVSIAHLRCTLKPSIFYQPVDCFSRVETIDGTAESGSDYVPVKKTLVFDPNQDSQELEIEIVDDSVWEPDEVFFVRLSIEPDAGGVIGRRGICQVIILNDDGTLIK